MVRLTLKKQKELTNNLKFPKQFWGHLVESGQIKDPRISFILYHISVSYVVKQRSILKERYEK